MTAAVDTDTTRAPRRTPRAAGAGADPSARAVFLSARAWVDVAVVLVLSVLGMVGLGSSFDAPDYLIAGLGGLLVGAAVAIAATQLRFGVPLTVALAVVAYYLLGTPIALPANGLAVVLPSIDTLSDLTIGPVFGWADILTLRPPVDLPSYVIAVPYVSGWLVALVSITIALRWTPTRRTAAIRAALVLLGPVALYVTGVLLGTDEPVFAAARGVGFGVIALVWLGWNRREHARIALAAPTTVVRRKVLGTVAVIAAGSLLGVAGGLLLTPPAENRFVLREEIQPPFEPLNYPSPLAAFRNYTKNLTEDTLFTVEGLQAGQRLRLAAMDTYDGILWGVAGAEQALDGSGAFQLVGAEFPEPIVHSGDATSELRVEVGAYDDVWVPETGYATQLDFEQDAEVASLENLRYNAATGTTVLTTGLRSGVSYRVQAEVQAAPDDEQLLDVPVAAFAPATVTNNPDPVVSLAGELTASAETPIEKLRALQGYLETNGYYSRGLLADQVPSRAGHGADRMAEMVENEAMVGDEEQYSSLFALMARSLGYPTRVVMGFAPELDAEVSGPVPVTGDDVTAWVEVAFEDVGWVPFDPTPDRTDPPQDQVPKPKTEPQPQVRQPPRTDTEQDDLVSPVDIDDNDEEEEDLFGIPGWVWAVLGGLLALLAIVFVPLLIVGALKRRRMRRRRAARADAAAAGAWDELTDRYSELGYGIPQKSTRTMVAAGLGSQIAAQTETAEPPALTPLASRTDDAVFSGRELTPEEVDRLWEEAMAAVQQTESALPGGRRIVSRYRLSSVRAWGSRLTAKADADRGRGR